MCDEECMNKDEGLGDLGRRLAGRCGPSAPAHALRHGVRYHVAALLVRPHCRMTKGLVVNLSYNPVHVVVSHGSIEEIWKHLSLVRSDVLAMPSICSVPLYKQDNKQVSMNRTEDEAKFQQKLNF